MLPCSVLLALLSPDLSVLGIAANVLAAPFGETVALPLCLGHALLGPLPLLEQGTATVASGALLVVRQLALAVGNSPWLRVEVGSPSAWQLGLAAMGFAAPFLLRQAHQTLRLVHVWPCVVGFLVAAVGLEWSQREAGAPVSRLRFTALDVGQGDASLIDLPNGELMLIDAGGVVGAGADPGARVVVPVLRARRRAHVDIVVLSHPHPDHFGGLEAVLRSVSVGELWDTGQGEREGAGPAYRQLLDTARENGVPLRRPSELCGRHERGGTTIEVLGPCPDFEPGDNPNDNSFVLRISFGSRAILLTGDAELAQEQRLLQRAPDALGADLLKVGHHGSRTSSSIEFLHRVGPAVATISCGQGNRFGHPHASALSALTRSGAEVYRTDVTGAVRWQTDGRDVRLGTFQDCCARFHF
jgi:competence protein ComEC